MSEKFSEQLYTLAEALKTTNRTRGIAIARIARKVAALEQQLAAKDAEIARLRKHKPCYVLGRTTIERVANEGQLETEHVAFVAAAELFHKNPYDRLAIVSCQCGQALLKWWPDCHMCGRKNAALAETPAAPEVK